MTVEKSFAQFMSTILKEAVGSLHASVVHGKKELASDQQCTCRVSGCKMTDSILVDLLAFFILCYSVTTN